MSSKRSRGRIGILLLVALLSATWLLPAGFAAADEMNPTGAAIDFQDAATATNGWQADNQYQLAADDGALKVQGNKNDIWAAFNYQFSSALDISQHPYVSVKVKAERDLNFSLYLWDAAQQYSYPKVTPIEVVHSGRFTEMTFDFTGQALDLSSITTIALIVNPATGFQGTFWIDDLKLGDQAVVAPNMTNVEPQSAPINAPEQTVKLRGIRNALGGSEPISLTAASSDPTLVPDPTIDNGGGGTATLHYAPSPDRYGTAIVTITAASGSGSRDFRFDVDIQRNEAPSMTAIGVQDLKAGQPYSVPLTGIDDGNSGARQQLTLTAVSSAPSVVPDPAIDYRSDDRYGTLTLSPPAGASGEADITVTVQDDGGTAAGGADTVSRTFHVRVFDSLNRPPTIGTIQDVVIDEDGTVSVPVTGLADGDGGTQQLTVTAVSSNPSVLPNPNVQYAPGDAAAALTLAPAAGATGEADVTVTVTDNGANGHNNGNLSAQTTFQVKVRTPPLLGLTENFDDGTFSDRWGNNGNDGVHTLSVQDGVLRIAVDKGNYPWAGLWYSLPKEMDLSENPYFSIKMKMDQPTKDVTLFLWDANGKYTTGTPGAITKTVTGDMTQYEYDFHDHFNSADGSKVDPTRITALMWTFAPAESNWKGTFYFDDLQVGDEADMPPISAAIDDIPDVTLSLGAGEQTIGLTGIGDGTGHTNGVTLTAVSSNATLVPDPTAGEPSSDGTATLRFTPATGQTGSADITVTASAVGTASTAKTFKVTVLDPSGSTPVQVDIDRGQTYQTMDGMGGFVSSGDQESKIDTLVNLANDLGVSIARFGVIDNDFEPVNDNSDPNSANYGAFNTDAIPWRTMLAYKERTGVDKFILTMWSPAWWLKTNKWVNAQDWAQDNRIDPAYYDEYAEELVAIVKTIKEKTGIDLYAISLQNEPEFNEPYASAQVSPAEYRDLLKAVGPRFEAEGLQTKIFMPEALPAQGHIADYVQAVNSDPAAAPYADILAIHNYDTDGIHVGGPGADGWKSIYQLSRQSPVKKVWMSETSGMAGDWTGAMTLAANIYQSLYYGNASAWVFWDMNDNFNTEGKRNSLFAVSEQFYKYIQPGAVRISAESQASDVLSLAFEDAEKHRFTTVLINSGTEDRFVSLKGTDLPSSYEAYLSSRGRSFQRLADVTDGTVLLPAGSVLTLYSGQELPPPSGDSEPPAAPAGLTATANPDGTVTLQWSASTDNVGVTGYNVYIGTQKANGAPIAGTTWQATGLAASTAYTFAVKAVDAAGNESAAGQPQTVTTAAGPPAEGGGALAYSPFDGTDGVLNGLDDGSGWAEPWTVQNGDTTLPGYAVEHDSPLAYPPLSHNGGYASGGSSYLTAYRTPDRQTAFRDYTTEDDRIGKPGTTLYYSALVRVDQDTTDDVDVGLGSFVSPVVSAGSYGAASQADGTAYWSLKLGDQTVRTNHPVTVGEAALLVVKVTFGDGATEASLYVDPPTLGGAEPSEPDARATMSASLTFRQLSFIAGNQPGVASVDEVRIGSDFAGVTPAADVPPEQPSPDVTGDGLVNIGDLTAVATAFGKPEAYRAQLDANRDGKVDIVDIDFVASALFGWNSAP
ncbi:fibronectin type III domain-containing protein [Cohnella zeiphila]|uniref:Fibronectin type III domain-containing protein n=1 Tax=Cohnella zeiphila TaxID=2761120 RepID=A0A7X0SP13_9BACL|nr:fibronectin type III domain-containing protein [Cohnella zeiphila]MBB6733542.1 fibronectin type III domain-containing protein [Cohnella zeiphila]